MNLFQRLLPHRAVPVLLYHRVADLALEQNLLRLGVSPREFEAQMRFLFEKRFKVISIEDVLRDRQKGERIKPKQIAITFDDGYVDNYENALPILQHYGFSATVFLVTDFLGKTRQWEGSSPVPLMKWSQIKEMTKHGISFQSHTCTHQDLTTLSEKALFRELLESKKKIEDMLAAPVHSLAYPYGRYNSEVARFVMQAGYQSAWAAGMADGGRFSLERFQVTADQGNPFFALRASGWASLVRRFRHFKI